MNSYRTLEYSGGLSHKIKDVAVVSQTSKVKMTIF